MTSINNFNLQLFASETYSLTVDSKKVEVTVEDGSITDVNIDGTSQTLSEDGSYTIGSYTLNLTYSDDLKAEVSETISPDVSNSTAYLIGDQIVTVDSEGNLSTDSVTIDGKTATLTYDSETKKITAAYTGDSTNPSYTTIRTYTTSGSFSGIEVIVNESTNTITSVTYNGVKQNIPFMYNGSNRIFIEFIDKELRIAYENSIGGSSIDDYALLSTEYSFTLDGTTQSIGSTETSKTITVGDRSYTITLDNGTLTATEIETFDPSTIYTFKINDQDVSVAIDSSGNITYNGESVSENKITVDGVEVTLDITDNTLNSVSYLGESYAVTDITKTTIDSIEDPVEDTGSIIYGSTDSTDDYRAPAVSDESVGTGSVGSTVEIAWKELGLAIGTNTVSGDSIDTNVPNTVTINENGEMAVADSSESDAIIEIDSDTNSANLVIDKNSDRSYNLTFHGGTIVGKWNATMSGGNDDLHIGNILGGHFDGGDGKDYFHVTKNLQGNVTLTGGATNDNLESGNNFYAESSSVSSASNQNKITITDVNFNANDVILIDAGVENLTADFFGDSRFYNYASAFDASTSGVYAGTIFDASDLVKDLGMSFSMLRMADKSSVTLDDENSIDENYITNVIWANSNSATIDFSSTQTDNVLVFTNTNSKGDIVSLGGDFDDTIHAGASDTIDAGGGDNLIYLTRRNHVVFGSSEGNDTIYGWDTTDTLDFSEIPDVSISSDGLYLENDNGTLLIDGSFTNSTNIRYNDGIMRVGDSSGNVVYNKNVTYYAGSTLVIDSSSNNTIDLSSSTYENISVIDASGASGRDTFRYTSDAGDVTISNGDSKDVVDLSSYSIDEISTQFIDNGLIISIDDSNLNIIGTNLTTFSLASGKYTADFQNQTFSE